MKRSVLTVLSALAVCASAAGTPGQATTLLASGVLIDLDGRAVGQLRLEQRGSAHVLQLTGAAGAHLEVLLSPSRRALRAGDHGGPGVQAVRVGVLNGADLRLPLPASLRLRSFQTVWVWCASVRLASARALLKWR